MLRTEYRNTAVIIYLEGEIDHHAAENIRISTERSMKENNIKTLIFDLSNVTFMDSAGIGMILGRYKSMGYIGGKIYLCAPNPNIKKLIELSGINKIIKITESAENALVLSEGGSKL